MNMIDYLHDQDRMYRLYIRDLIQEAEEKAQKKAEKKAQEAEERVKKEAIKNEIVSIIEVFNTLGKSIPETVDYIASKYKLTKDEAESRVNKHWNDKK